MKVNEKKTKNLISNLTRIYQFRTDIKLKGEKVKTINNIKLLGTTITNDLKWNENTKMIVKSSNKRMQFLHRAAKFTNNISDLKMIYMLQIRSKLEQSAVVWHSGLTDKNKRNLERVQKSALKIILKEKYIDYKNALSVMKMDSLEVRREKLCLKFAKACVKNEKVSDIFPRDCMNHSMEKRGREVFYVKKAKTERLRKSAVVSIQNLLNKDVTEKRNNLRKISNYMPVNYDCMQSLSL